jgi:hypothetical protein
MMNAVMIFDAQGRQVLGLDSVTQLHLYRRGDRSFSLPGGLTMKILCDLPNAADANSLETLDGQNAIRHGEETTIHHSGTFGGD